MSNSSTKIPVKTWTWQGFPITYQSQGERGPAIVFVHGFGASWGHWRKTLQGLSSQCRCFAIDLIGFGGSAKPTPGVINYTFETWGKLIIDFCQEVVKSPVFLVGNSIGCIAIMQGAIESPSLIQGVVLLNCSLRLIHEKRLLDQPWYRQVSVPMIQNLLRIKWISQLFFQQIAKPPTVRKILQQAYGRSSAVTDELIDMILTPAKDEGALEVFVAFTRYSHGPLPEELLPLLSCPVLVIWGADDPWEPLDLAQKLLNFPSVKNFITLDGVGHCPQDEAPELVNPILLEWIGENYR